MISNDNRNRSQRDVMIDTMNKSQVRRMGKLVDFFLNSRTKLPAKTIKLLSKNQEFVKAITENKVPISTKKRIFKQKGGILPMLLPFAAKAAAPLAGSLLSGYIRKNYSREKMAFKKSILISNDIWEKVKSNYNNFSSIKKKKKKSSSPPIKKPKLQEDQKQKLLTIPKHSIRYELNGRAREHRKKSNLMKNGKIFSQGGTSR